MCGLLVYAGGEAAVRFSLVWCHYVILVSLCLDGEADGGLLVVEMP